MTMDISKIAIIMSSISLIVSMLSLAINFLEYKRKKNKDNEKKMLVKIDKYGD